LGNVEEPLHHMYILKIHILKVYGQTSPITLLPYLIYIRHVKDMSIIWYTAKYTHDHCRLWRL